MLKGEIGYRLRDLARQISSDMGVEILSGVVAKEHIHLLVSMLPEVAVRKLVQTLKGKTSYKLQREYEVLRKQYWANGCGRGDILPVVRGT